NGDCPPVTLNGVVIPGERTPKYLGMTLDRRLTWRTHILRKRKQAEERVRQYQWLIGRRSKLKMRLKLLVYKSVIKPIWTYGIQLWGTASMSNRRTIQRFQNKTLRMVSAAHPLHDNRTIHQELGMPWVAEEIVRISTKYIERLHNHPNALAINLLDNSRATRRLKRAHPLDLP
ncbi:hypothetical protein KR222_003427, partial [Zaprionus bogoriensis]